MAENTTKEQKIDSRREQVEAMASFGVTQDQIARCLGISAPTLRKRYPIELETGATKATVLVAQNLFRIATGEGREAVTAAIFWLKTRGGWREERPETVFVAPPLGKKELAANAAASAGQGSEWADDLAFDGGERLN